MGCFTPATHSTNIRTKRTLPCNLYYSVPRLMGRPSLTTALLDPGTGQSIGEDVRLRSLLSRLELLGLSAQSPLEADEEGGVDGSELSFL